MKTSKIISTLAIMFFLFTASLIKPLYSYAHCDTLDGPVVAEARQALAKGDIMPLLKWVSADDEKMIHTAFQKTLEVRKLSDQSRELGDMYFFETLVRIHRASEGAPYTGLKPGSAVDPAVALADKALDSGSVDKLVDVLSDAMAKGIREYFERALEAKKNADKSVIDGRKYVESYVMFTHYVEGLHGIIKGGAKHHDHE
ncbi:MAG: DUF6448 family protein [Candidatus Scalindua sp.]|nr:DUF6448 family protein [Candidatus Scalindua sp.]MCR4344075.1 DUF6448 family protein [Candidatus Scalindua sp.]